MKKRMLVCALVVAGSCREVPSPELPPEGPVEWSVRAATDKNEVQVGQDLTLTLTIRHPPGGHYQPPPAADFGPFEVLELKTEEVSPVETRLSYRLSAYRLPGELRIPALRLHYRDESEEVRELVTEEIPVRLSTSLTPDVTEIHDIKDPVGLSVPRDYRVLWPLAVLLAAGIAYLAVKKFRKAPLAEAPAPDPPPPPDVEAEAALRRLAEKQLIEKGEILAFYSELAEIMKRYAGRRFEVPYLERTTSEILADLGNGHADLRAILEQSDLVKFAKLMLEADKARGSFALAERFVAETRPSAHEEAIA
ncbi:MAG TPA: hypothetical protein VLK65_10830 [Vicinamibacteria bacterium]|nr:hypothetical protein [Vicinamibacteria bacterium]